MAKAMRLWHRRSLEGREFKPRLGHRISGKLCQSAPVSIREGQGSKSLGMGIAFHKLSPRYRQPLIPTASAPTRLWKTFMSVKLAPCSHFSIPREPLNREPGTGNHETRNRELRTGN